MNKLSVSKILDVLAMIAIIAVFALWMFKKMPFAVLSVSLICIALLKMGAAMLKSSYFEKLYEDINQENNILNEKCSYLEQEINQLKNKTNTI
ncbi:MAG: hypothetical protein J6P44_00250 [Bacteroidales bacterium]|nr:hypothetical protein [Bacteroidales bacterium]